MAQLKLPEKCDDEDGTAILCIAYLRQSDARFRQDWSHDVLRGATKTVYTSEDTSSGRVTVVPYWNNEKFAGNKALISEVPNDVNALEESLMYDKKSLHKVLLYCV